MAATLYTRMALDVPLHDATGGYRVFRASTLRALELHNVASQGYCFQVDMARRTVASGMRVVEVPITFVEREYGTSKMSGSIVREALWRVTVWGAQERAEKARAAVRRRREMPGLPARGGRGSLDGPLPHPRVRSHCWRSPRWPPSWPWSTGSAVLWR